MPPHARPRHRALQYQADVDHVGAVVSRPRDPGRELVTRGRPVRRDLDGQQLAAPADACPLPVVVATAECDLGDHRAVADLIVDVIGALDRVVTAEARTCQIRPLPSTPVSTTATTTAGDPTVVRQSAGSPTRARPHSRAHHGSAGVPVRAAASRGRAGCRRRQRGTRTTLPSRDRAAGERAPKEKKMTTVAQHAAARHENRTATIRFYRRGRTEHERPGRPSGVRHKPKTPAGDAAPPWPTTPAGWLDASATRVGQWSTAVFNHSDDGC